MNEATRVAAQYVSERRTDILATLAEFGFVGARVPDASLHPEAGVFELLVDTTPEHSLIDLVEAERVLEDLIGLAPELISSASDRGRGMGEGAEEL